ncbi:TetR/AcrR family transcriptional regulator [Hydromonas duriensis]|uniref:TetR family transcriptional regulator n=1 Tax=Hydromonas duriensis TaxID=1527608 RepID=A0A4R6Y8Z5_9BURK|nr:TetR/AcrR family transcriptional regulator [Hydromonas duriensis]TDR31871.1 TetR family transcriptional regulator [Hydromonas duriensis]
MNQKHDRQEALEKGLQLLCENSYHNIGVNLICQQTGMTKGAFYNAFKSKENFLIEVLNVFAQSSLERIRYQLSFPPEQPAVERLKNFYIQMLEQQPSLNFAGCFVNNIMSELGAQNEAVAECTSLLFNSFVLAIQPCVLEAQEQGAFDKNLSAKDIAQLLHASFYGALTCARGLRQNHQAITNMNLLFKSLTTSH